MFLEGMLRTVFLLQTLYFTAFIATVETSSQAPSYASPKLSPTDSLTGVKCRATSVAKKYGKHRWFCKCQSFICAKKKRNVAWYNWCPLKSLFYIGE